MKNRRKTCTIAVLSIIFMISVLQNRDSVQAASAWDGTYDDTWYTDNPNSVCYYIGKAEQFAAIPHIICDYGESFYGRTIYLTANIVLNSTQNYTADEDGSVVFNSDANVWKTIPQTEANAFRGCLDGKNYRIQGMYIPATVHGQYRGLFGRVEKGGEIKNLNIEYFYIGENGSTSVSTDDYSGAVAGLLKEAKIESCSVKKGTITTAQFAGGIVGSAQGNSYITSCLSSCLIEGGYCIGGIAGYSYADIYNCQSSAVITIKYTSVYGIGGIAGIQKNLNAGALKIYGCSYSGEIIGGGSYTGGIAGQAADSMKLQCCMVSADIEGNSYTGGIAGMTNSCNILQCGVTGSIKGGTKMGGICGYPAGASAIRNSFFAGSLEGQGGCIYGVSREDSELLVKDCVYDKDRAGETAVRTHTLYDEEGITGITTEEMENGAGAYYIDLLDGGRHLNLWTQGAEYPEPVTDVYQTPIYRVRFFNDTEGDAAAVFYTDSSGKLTDNLPKPPAKKGYDAAWDHKRFDNISADIDVYPIYQTKYFTVNFLINGEVYQSRQAAYGAALAQTPEIPYRPGYTGRWGETGIFAYITSDIDAELAYDPVAYTISYHGNGAAGEEVRQTCYYDTCYTLADVMFEREGYTFAGWNTQKDGSGTAYQDGAAIYNLTALPDMEIELYAVWDKASVNVLEASAVQTAASGTEQGLLSLAADGEEAGDEWEVSGNEEIAGTGTYSENGAVNRTDIVKLCENLIKARSLLVNAKNKALKTKKISRKKRKLILYTIRNGG